MWHDIDRRVQRALCVPVSVAVLAQANSQPPVQSWYRPMRWPANACRTASCSSTTVSPTPLPGTMVWCVGRRQDQPRHRGCHRARQLPAFLAMWSSNW